MRGPERCGVGVGHSWVVKLRNDLQKTVVPRTRFELARDYSHHPLKMACLPISPPGLGVAGALKDSLTVKKKTT